MPLDRLSSLWRLPAMRASASMSVGVSCGTTDASTTPVIRSPDTP